MQDKERQTWKNRLVPNWEKNKSRLYIVTALFNLDTEDITRKASLDDYKLESRLPGEMSKPEISR